MQEKTLESILDNKEINQPILKEINPEYSLEGPMQKLNFQCFGHLMPRADSIGKTLMLERLRTGGDRATESEMVEWHH